MDEADGLHHGLRVFTVDRPVHTPETGLSTSVNARSPSRGSFGPPTRTATQALSPAACNANARSSSQTKSTESMGTKIESVLGVLYHRLAVACLAGSEPANEVIVLAARCGIAFSSSQILR
jgi:hypothetical protein